jgi:pimeloyl-ACP methyl ester carboxylesterase
MAGTLVLFVHGLWMPGPESALLRRRVGQQLGVSAELFTWRTVSEAPGVVAARLHERIRERAPQELHLIGHSLGGLAVLQLLARHPQQPPGRVVLLGSPTAGSLSAEQFTARFPPGQRLVGPFLREEVLGRHGGAVREWPHAGRPLGVIAGTRSLGLGRFFAQFDQPNDGTVALRETAIAGAADRLTLPVSHFGMLVSRQVARQTALFLRDGHFGL